MEERGSATSPTRSSPTKEGGTRRLAGELLQGDVLVATKQLLGSVRKMGDVHSRIYGDVRAARFVSCVEAHMVRVGVGGGCGCE